MLQNRHAMLAPIALIVADWFMTLGVLWGCFYAVGLEVPLPLVTVGFAIGILTTLISITPAGLGIMESAMTTIFVSLGTPLEPTIIAVLLFRLTFYAIPFALSVGFFHGMFEDARRHSHIE
ncbi:MAG: flippase-like domain-containing protein, partial [Deltaproteobacteria bacterium]